MQDVITRWNSTYFMIERLLEQRWAIYAVIHDDKFTKPNDRYLDLKTHQWEILQQMVAVLKPLQVATTALCEEQNISVSLVYPVINGLVRKHLVVKEEDLTAVKNFKETVQKELKHRFNHDNPDPTSAPVIAAALDPCYHQLKLLTSPQRLNVYEDLKERIKNILDTNAETPLEEPVPKRPKKETAMSFPLSETTAVDDLDEVEGYLKEQPLSPDKNGLEWWENNQDRFPTVAEVVKQYFTIPATSVPSERIFSTAGLIVNQQQSSLKPVNVDMLIFLNKNLY